MTLQIFKDKIREQCKILFSTLRDGSRKDKLKLKKVNSLTDVMFFGRENPRKLYQSCIITFGNVLERATMSYAKEMKAKVYKDKRFLAADIDIVFRIRKIVYNLESKSNIELDLGKTKKALETLNRKHKVVFNALDCQNERWQVVSKFIVWTKEDAEEASKIAKKPLERKNLMGFKDFFNLFNIQVNKEDFFKMLQKVWIEEVEVYF
jgi:hypothetical protein